MAFLRGASANPEGQAIDLQGNLKGSQLRLTNASLFDDGINSRILVLQAAFPGWPLN